jgi:hypothetical protein
MLAQLQKNVQTLLRGKLFIKIPVSFVRGSEVLEFPNRLFHEKI